MKGYLFTYLLTYGGSLVALFYPFYGVLIYFAFAIISPPTMWFWLDLTGRYSFTIAMAMLVGWAFASFGRWNFGRGTAIVYSLVALWGWGLLSGRFSERPEEAMNWSLEQAKIVLPFLVGITLIQTVRQLKQLAWVLMLSQAYVAYELNLAYWSGYNRVYENGHAGMDNNCISIAMVTGAGLAFFLGVREREIWKKAICFGGALLMVHIPMIGMSRGGMLSLCVTGALSFMLIPKRPMSFVWLLLAVAVGIRLAGPSVVERFSSTFVKAEDRDASAESRVEMWRACYDIMITKPIFGVGPAQWKYAAPQYGFKQGKEAHSLWMQMGAELGLIGLAFLVMFYGITCWRLIKIIMYPPEDDPWHVDCARMTLAALTGFMVSATFVTIIGLEVPFYTVLLGAGTLKISSLRAREHTRPRYVGVAPAPMAGPLPSSQFGGAPTA